MVKSITLPDEKRATRTFEVTVSGEALEAEKNEVLKYYRKNAKLRGFRAGKAPMSLILAQFGEKIDKRSREEAIRKTVVAYIKEHDVKAIGEIAVSNVEDGADNSLAVKVTVEVMPVFNIPDLSLISVKKHLYRVKDEDVDLRIDEIRRGLATQREVDRGIAEEDSVSARLVERDGEGKVLFEGDVFIEFLRDELDAGLYGAMEGKKVGDEVLFEVTVPQEDGSSEARKQTYEIKSVKETVLPALDESFAKLQGADSVEELRVKVRADLEEQTKERSESDFEWGCINETNDVIGFELPLSLVRGQFQELMRNFQGRDLSDEEREDVAKRMEELAKDLVKRELLLTRLVEERNIEVSDEELEKEVAELAAKNKTKPEKFMKQLVKRGRLESVKFGLRLRKGLEHLKNSVKVEAEIA